MLAALTVAAALLNAFATLPLLGLAAFLSGFSFGGFQVSIEVACVATELACEYVRLATAHHSVISVSGAGNKSYHHAGLQVVQSHTSPALAALCLASSAQSKLGKRIDEVSLCWLPELQLCQSLVAERALCAGCCFRVWCPR